MLTLHVSYPLSLFISLFKQSLIGGEAATAHCWQGKHLGIERKHLDLRTRIKQLAKTIRFSKSTWSQDIMIGLLINSHGFGRTI
jgi:hypothetical protein